MSITPPNENDNVLSEESSLYSERVVKRIGKYEIFYEIGTGGMATVYLARMMTTTGVEKWVALKKTHQHLAKEKKFLDMFFDEARLATLLQHPNVVQVFDVGEHEGIPYLVMEYLNGESLTSLLNALMRAKLKLQFPVAAKIISYVCDGLHHAHELKDNEGVSLGVVHRDISPQNIFISYDGIVKLVDFGIAKATKRVAHTQTGDLKGKSSYMSPEQALGQQVDRRSDIFSLGIVLYEITTFVRLFKTESEFETLRKVISSEITPPSRIIPGYPEILEKIVLKALQPKLELRYQTAREMQKDLEQYIQSSGKVVGTPEINELMYSFFSDRIKKKQQLQVTEPKEAISIMENLKTQTSLLMFDNTRKSLFLKRLYDKKKILYPVFIAALLLIVTISAYYIIQNSKSNKIYNPVNLSVNVNKYARIEIETIPPKAVIYIDGNEAGFSPLKLEKISSGMHQIVLKKDGYAEKIYDIVLERGDSRHYQYTLNKIENKQDRSYVLKSNLNNKIKQFNEITKSVSQNRGKQIEKNKHLPINLQFGKLSIRTVPWSKAYLDGNYLGYTPIAKMKVSAGEHKLRLLPEGKEPAKEILITVKNDEEIPVSVNF